MKLNIKQYKFEKVETSSKEVELPTETCYFFETGIRRSIKITPRFTTWNKERFDKEEELYSLDVICVYNSFECVVEMFNIPVSRIEEIYYSKNNDKYKDFVVGLIDKHFRVRTKEQFDGDFNYAISKMQES